ncbi:MAG: hypothetical protein WC538_00940 [Thermoanaerobaculia bacterium]|jgi:hypothetical protein
MSPRKIDDHFRDYYESREPSAEAMKRLLAVAAGESVEKPAPRSLKSSRGALLAVAASITVAVLAGLLLVSRPAGVRPGAEGPVSTALATLGHEAADRHLHCAMTEFHGSDFAAVASQMSKLDFVPVLPGSDELAGLTVEGGHYCMLDGRMALHLYMTDGHGSRVSVLEVRAGDALMASHPVRQELDGLRVSLSVSRNVVVAFVRSA